MMLQADARMFQSPDAMASLAASHHRHGALERSLSCLVAGPEE